MLALHSGSTLDECSPDREVSIHIPPAHIFASDQEADIKKKPGYYRIDLSSYESDSVDAFLKFLYTFDHSNDHTSALNTCWTTVDLCLLAHRYQVDGLKESYESSFEGMIKDVDRGHFLGWPEHVSRMVEKIYNCRDFMPALRPSLVSAFASQRVLATKEGVEAFRAIMVAIPEFAIDVAHAAAEQMERVENTQG